MAGDWIKMRGGLFSSPKLIAMTRRLQESKAFREWLTPGGASPINGQVVSDHALRCVTGALLCVTWSWSRQFGKKLPNYDCLLPCISVDDIDGIAGAPSFGDAMYEVGWALDSPDGAGVILPKFFKEHNVALTPAEKQAAYRARNAESCVTENVTGSLPRCGNKTVTRVEESREEESREKGNQEPPIVPQGTTDLNGQSKTDLNSSGKKKKKRRVLEYDPIFEKWWAVYPKKAGKEAAQVEWFDARKRLAVRHPDWSDDQIRCYLGSRACEYAKSYLGRCFPLDPERWLKRGRFDDDPASWESHGTPSPEEVDVPYPQH